MKDGGFPTSHSCYGNAATRTGGVRSLRVECTVGEAKGKLGLTLTSKLGERVSQLALVPSVMMWSVRNNIYLLEDLKEHSGYQLNKINILVLVNILTYSGLYCTYSLYLVDILNIYGTTLFTSILSEIWVKTVLSNIRFFN